MRISMFFLLALAVLSASCGSGDKPEQKMTPPMEARSYDVHIFYYAWYGTPQVDGSYRVWNLEIDGRDGRRRSYPGGDDIASSFYPAGGCYSSNDIEVLKRHMGEVAAAQIGVICVSWEGKDSFSDRAVMKILDTADLIGIKVNFHIEPFEGRDAEAVRESITYIIDRYGSHGAFYRTDRFRVRPMFYIHESGLIDPGDWAGILSPGGSSTIRGTTHDAIVIGQWTDENDGELLLAGGFDGYYTYLGSEGHTYGSTVENWSALDVWAWENDMIFIPTIAPGYDDSRVRPWNAEAIRLRDHGGYYQMMTRAAIQTDPAFITISSFNHWQEGTQLESCMPMSIPGFTYRDYRDPNPYFYMKQTLNWIKAFSR